MVNPVPQTQTDFPLRQFIILLVGVVVAIAIAFSAIHLLQSRDPYVQQVLAVDGDVAQGHEIFKVNCAACHGIDGDGAVGPSLKSVSERKSRVGLINQVISGKTPPMPRFQPSPEVMADLLRYLESL